jgi:hypothetical protein
MEHLNEVLEEETEWGISIKPKDIYSALLLPRSSFEPRTAGESVWALAEQYGDRRHIEHVASTIEQFRTRHWLTKQADGHYGRDLYFDNLGERHGIADFPKNWKYSLRFEDGFHFDVSSARKRGFNLCDATGAIHNVINDEHLNVDPHGYVRG